MYILLLILQSLGSILFRLHRVQAISQVLFYINYIASARWRPCWWAICRMEKYSLTLGVSVFLDPRQLAQKVHLTSYCA